VEVSRPKRQYVPRSSELPLLIEHFLRLIEARPPPAPVRPRPSAVPMGQHLQRIDEEEGKSSSSSASEQCDWRSFDSCVHLLAVALAASAATLLLSRLCAQQTPWLPAVAAFRRQPAHCGTPLADVDAPPPVPPVPPVLAHLAVYVAFHWDITHLTALSRVRGVGVLCLGSQGQLRVVLRTD